MPRFHTLIDLLETQAELRPNALAFRFLADGENESGQVTYKQLQRQVRSIASYLQSHFELGDSVILVYPDSGGLEFIAAFFACLYAGLVAVPVNPTRNQKIIVNLINRVEYCGAKAILSNHAFQNYLAIRLHDEPILTEKLWRQPWINTDQTDNGPADQWRPSPITPEMIALC
jgi:acyl-CoA synthetase (AMP-forming)/AMP-acid ligase II